MLDVSEQDVARVKPGTEVKLSTASLGDDRIGGHVLQVADLVDPQTAHREGARGLSTRPTSASRPRCSRSRSSSSQRRAGTSCPRARSTCAASSTSCSYDQGGGRYARRAIVPGPISDGYQAVLGGIAATDKVVVDGNLLLERLLASKD
jgi:hypothetical protein